MIVVSFGDPPLFQDNDKVRRETAKSEMKLSDYLVFIPIGLCVAVVFAMPTDADKGSIAEVRATVTKAINYVSELVTGQPATVILADAPQLPPEPMGSGYVNGDTRERKKQRTQQLWEDRPRQRDYSNGPATSLTYGESQRDSVKRAPR